MPHRPEHISAALKHLSSADPVMRTLIRRVGPFRIRLERDRFQMLVHSIISQQISGKAADSIRRRVQTLAGEAGITAESIGQLSPADLRSAGLSPQKLNYVLDLSQKVRAGEVQLQRLGRMTDDQVIAELTKVKGIGVWTAQMALMFSLGRLDVFPHDDLGIRSALRNLYGLNDLPDRATSHRIAEPWRPYATVASWYCWRSHDVD